MCKNEILLTSPTLADRKTPWGISAAHGMFLIVTSAESVAVSGVDLFTVCKFPAHRDRPARKTAKWITAVRESITKLSAAHALIMQARPNARRTTSTARA